MKTYTPPTLIVMHGLSGSGKTTASLLLAQELNAELLRTDIERKRLFGLKPLESSQAAGLDIYTPEANLKTYVYLQEKASDILNKGRSVILDGAFLKREERIQCSETALRCNSSYLIVKCMASDTILKERISKRQSSNTDASEAMPSLIDQQKIWEEPLKDDESEHSIVINTALDDWEKRLLSQVISKII